MLKPATTEKMILGMVNRLLTDNAAAICLLGLRLRLRLLLLLLLLLLLPSPNYSYSFSYSYFYSYCYKNFGRLDLGFHHITICYVFVIWLFSRLSFFSRFCHSPSFPPCPTKIIKNDAKMTTNMAMPREMFKFRFGALPHLFRMQGLLRVQGLLCSA